MGLGKTHLSIALGHTACLRGNSVLFTAAVLIIDELGYLPIDKQGADLLFQIISQRYERAPIVITTNRTYKHWSSIFNNDSTLTSALLDRLLHHAETIVIDGKSYRTRDDPHD